MWLLKVFTFFALCFIACTKDYSTFPNSDLVWVAIEPIQCMGNPWEQDWLESHNQDYSSYPKSFTDSELEPEIFKIIKYYYYRHGVNIFAGETAHKYDAVCAACSCPAGYTLYLLVEAENVQKMIGFGYRKEIPD
jgi:hypothetical protein